VLAAAFGGDGRRASSVKVELLGTAMPTETSGVAGTTRVPATPPKTGATTGPPSYVEAVLGNAQKVLDGQVGPALSAARSVLGGEKADISSALGHLSSAIQGLGPALRASDVDAGLKGLSGSVLTGIGSALSKLRQPAQSAQSISEVRGELGSIEALVRSLGTACALKSKWEQQKGAQP